MSKQPMPALALNSILKLPNVKGSIPTTTRGEKVRIGDTPSLLEETHFESHMSAKKQSDMSYLELSRETPKQGNQLFAERKQRNQQSQLQLSGMTTALSGPASTHFNNF